VYLNYINNFRAFAIAIVVLYHIFSLFSWEHCDFFHKIILLIVQNPTVYFVFISGFLFQHLSVKYEFKKYITKKFNNVLLPYLIISVPAVIHFILTMNDVSKYASFFKEPVYMQVIHLYLTGMSLPQLWYIPMITLFFLVAPVLIKIDRNPAAYSYLIPVAMVATFYFPRSRANDIFPSFLYFLSVYLIGMVSSRYREKVVEYSSKYLIQLFILFFSLILIGVYVKNTGIHHHILGYLDYLSKMVGCYSFIGLLCKTDNLLKDKFDYIAKYSFGIYFIHEYFILFFERLNHHLLKIDVPVNLLTVIFCFLVVMSLSVLSIKLIKKIFPDSSRKIIGC